jgi:serine/threonine protein kinase
MSLSLWDMPPKLQDGLIESCIGKDAKLIGKLSTANAYVFTFDHGENSLPRYFVAKCIPLAADDSAEQRKKKVIRFLHELNQAYRVYHHPLVHRFFDVRFAMDQPFVLSRKRDATLFDVIREYKLSLTDSLIIATQIAHALNYCTKHGLECHQDLKPENIFMDLMFRHFELPKDDPIRYRPLVADFGLANGFRILGRPGGSRPYLAPEQYQSSAIPVANTDDFSKVDVFALGVMITEMLSGGIHPIGKRTSLIWPSPPSDARSFTHDGPWKKWLKDGALIAPSAQPVDQGMKEIVTRCLAIDVRQRLTIAELEAALLERLATEDKNALNSLATLLKHYDDSAMESEAGGWPFYDERLRQVNESFS